MNSNSIIVTQWFRETLDEDARLFYKIWREALRKFCGEIPILLIHNGGPTDPPYDDVEIVPAVGMVPHERDAFGHWHNCWRSMCYGWELSAKRGKSAAIFISQNLIVGTSFVRECEDALLDADVLINLGCLAPELAFTEYMAVNPVSCGELLKKEYTQEMPLLEGMVPVWIHELRLREKSFPKLWRLRDSPLNSNDTYLHHLPVSDAVTFAAVKGIPY